MRDKEITGLYQAYLDVYSNLNEEVEQLDEISPEVISRTDLRRRKNLYDTEAEEMRARDAGATMGELSRLSANTSTAAAKVSKHRRLSSAHARSRARMNKEEVENWVNSLIEEGYDLSEYTWDDMYEMYVTEADSIAAMRERAAKRRKQRYGASDTSRGGRDDFAPITDYEAANKKWARPTQKEETDLFGAILEHLVAEGYADTNESALAIMANMSEEWRQDIMEISDRKVAAVGRRRQANVDKAMSSDEYISDEPGATQKLATAISKKNRFNYLNKKRERMGG
jgi:hypothetical protein